MGYQWALFAHLVGVFGFLIVHGVSISVGLRLRKERDPAKINSLLDISGRTVQPMYFSLALLLGGGIVAAFLGHLWSFGWIWASIAALVVVSMGMYAMARPYYQKVRFITRAVAEGSKAVTPEQFDSVLRGRRPVTITWVGFAGLLFILYLMVFKPTLGLKPGEAAPGPAPSGVVLQISAKNNRFSASSLSAPAGQAFSISFRNDEAVPHNVSIYQDSSASKAFFKGEQFGGPRTTVYAVPSLAAGTYFFRCDVHPTEMTGTLKAG